MIQWLHARPRLVRNGSRVRAALATAALGPVLAGCALPGSGELPRAEPPRPLPQGCAPPSLAYVVSFLPPVDDRSKAALTEQFLAELRASELFGELVPGPGPAQVQLAVDMTQVPQRPEA